MQPAFEPRARCKRTGWIDVGSLVKQHRHKTIDVVRETFEVDVVKLLPGLNAEPQFLVIVVQGVGKLIDESSDIFPIGRIDLLPIDYHTGCLGVAQNRDHFADESLLSISWTMGEILDRFRLPVVADEIGQQRHQCDPFARSKFRQPGIRVDLQFAQAVDHRHPFGANVSDLRRVLLERCVAIGITIGIKREPHFITRRFFSRAQRRRRC